MGQLFSRAFKRLTGCNQSSSSQRSSSQQDDCAKQQEDDRLKASAGRSTLASTQSIPVGQSIDSADYRAMSNSDCSAPATTNGLTGQQEDSRQQQQAEEAVIKIQALVRGHLTRKALKADAGGHQPNGCNQLPAQPNSLGQSQFDARSLTRDPPSAIFLSDTPLTLDSARVAGNQQDPQPQQTCPLEPIAELTDEPAQAAGQSAGATSRQAEGERAKLSPLCTSVHRTLAPASDRQQSLGEGAASPSPVPSENNASIDLQHEGCATPASASASIDLATRPQAADKTMASVLHLRPADEAPGECPAVGSPDSLESEEAAAIRIQSAFRGYRTRKNSPYRAASSPSSLAGSGLRRSLIIRDEERESAERLLEEGDESAKEAEETGGQQERRSSRAKHRDLPASQLDHEPRAGSGSSSDSPADRASERTVKLAEGECQLSGDAEPTTADAHANGQTEGTELEEPTGSINGSITGERMLNPALSSLGESEDVTTTLELEPLDLESSALEEATTTTTEAEVTREEEAATDNNETATESNGDRLVSNSISLTDRHSIDTDSSVLGAALSLNEEQPSSLAAAAATGGQQMEPISENEAADSNLVELDLESEARRLVDEMLVDEDEEPEAEVGEEELDELPDECALEEDAEQDQDQELELEVEVQPEAEVEPPETNEEQEAAEEPEAEAVSVGALQTMQSLNEDEQLAIELESDDIERRDPRGQVTEKRDKSPQIRLEAPEFEQQVASVISAAEQSISGLLQAEEQPEAGGGSQVASSRSSAANSSASSGNEEDSDSDNEKKGTKQRLTDELNDNNNNNDAEDKEENNRQQEENKRQQQTGSRNKNRRNQRNKRKGKK